MAVQETFISDLAAFDPLFDELMQAELTENDQKYKACQEVEKDGVTKVKQYRQHQGRYLQQIDVNKKVDSQRKSELHHLEKSVDRLREFDGSFPEKVKLHNKESKREEQVLESKKEDLRKKDIDKKEKLRDLREGISYYSDLLGLTFELVSPGVVRFVFTKIDPENADREFFFTLKVGVENVYRIDICQPILAGSEALLSDLNTTSDLTRFVVQMRKLFVNHVIGK